MSTRQSKINSYICPSMVKNFEIQLSEVQSKGQLIDMNGESGSKRTKRDAPLNFIGNILGDIIGLLDSRYARKIKDFIEKTHEKQEFALELYKNHTSLLDATTNILKRDEVEIANQFGLINKHFTAIEETFGAWFTDEAELRLTSYFSPD